MAKPNNQCYLSDGDRDRISWGDPLNYCKVEHVDLCGAELMVAVSVMGTIHDAECAAITTASPPILRIHAMQQSETCLLGDASDEDVANIELVFKCNYALELAEDILFSYAPGYTCASILDMILMSVAHRNQVQASHSFKKQEQYFLNATEISIEQDSNLDVKHCRRNSEQSGKANSTFSKPGENLNQGGDTFNADDGANISFCPLHAEEQVKREDGFSHNSRFQVQDRLPQSMATSRACSGPIWGPRGDEICAAAESGHYRIAEMLERRIRKLDRLRVHWDAGDARCLAHILNNHNDQALLYGVFVHLSDHHNPIPAQSLSWLLPLASRLSNSDFEDHAVAAMRFILQVLQVSWPTVAKALSNVATPRPLLEACENVVGHLGALLASVRAMSRSVRISRTNGPLVPVCRKLKLSLEDALASVGRVRGAGPKSSSPRTSVT